jgi:hypothetical protein
MPATALQHFQEDIGASVFKERPPAGLLGLIGGMRVATAVTDLLRKRRKPPSSGLAEPGAAADPGHGPRFVCSRCLAVRGRVGCVWPFGLGVEPKLIAACLLEMTHSQTRR